MGNLERNTSKVDLLGRSLRHKVNLLAWVCLTIPFFLMQGCGSPQGTYIGKMVDPPATRVVIFEIEGEDGEEVTRMIATKLTALGKQVIYGEQFGKPADLMVAAKIARDNNAEAFIMGKITESKVWDFSKYTISGNFSLHSIERGEQIGGINNARCTEDIDPLLGLSKTFHGLAGKEKEKKVMAIKVEETRTKSSNIRQKLAEYVGDLLCCEGLGGEMKGMKGMKKMEGMKHH